jgi:hypothetical protein
MDTGTIIINMPLKSYLCKFLEKKYGNHHKVSINSSLGIYLTDLLDKQYRKEHKNLKEKNFYPFHFPKTIIERQGFDMSSAKMKKFEMFLQKLFLSSMDDYITTSMHSNLVVKSENSILKQDVMKAMKQFLKCYDVTEDELKLENLYRNYHRDKSSLGQLLES